MATDDRDIDALFGSVAGHERIDWDRLEAGATDRAQRSRVRSLREVARIADFHHSLQAEVTASSVRAGVETWGSLLLLERVGAGTSGEVYRAWDPALQREVALKLLRTRDGAGPGDWLEEARSLARVSDPHVVAVFGAAEHDGRPGLWMEFLRGESLDATVARRGPLPPDEVARLGVELARALAAVHAAGALHRDVKPANVMLEPGGRAVLADFGLGRRGEGTSPGQPFSGTPMFMSPARLAGQPARASDDVYAVGVTLRWTLTGTPPWHADGIEQLRAAVAVGPAQTLYAERPDAPAELIAAIERAMDPEPARRFPDARAMVAAFESAVPATPGPAGSGVAGARPAQVSRWIATAVAVVGVVGVIAVLRDPGRQIFGAKSTTDAPGPTLPRVAVPAPGAADAAAYDVSASLVRRGASGDRALDPGDRVGPGDRLSLEFHATRPLYTYVLEADDRGECYLLFPQPLFDRRNPLPGAEAIVLPGTRGGREAAWTVTSRGGREHFLIVAAPQPVAELETEIAQLPAPVPGRPIDYARVGAATMERLRGVGGVSEAPASPALSGPARVFENMRSLAGREQGVHGVWVRQIVLANPLH